jgi:membrane associated rhomboid family serine protease
MFPLRDDNPHFSTPWITWALIAANVAVWVFVQGLGGQPALATSVCTLGMVPGELLGTLPPGLSVPVARGILCTVGDHPVWITLLTHMFMHGGWMHILGNMWFLWIFGNNVEDAMGHARFLAFYLLCGLTAAGLQLWADPASPLPMVGASGAIGGVMGAYIMLFPRVNVHLLLFLGIFITTVAVPAYFMLGYWIVLQLIGGVSSIGAQSGGTAFWAHVGGFAAGALLVLGFRDPQRLARYPYHGWRQQDTATERWRRIP